MSTCYFLYVKGIGDTLRVRMPVMMVYATIGVHDIGVRPRIILGNHCCFPPESSVVGRMAGVSLMHDIAIIQSHRH